MGEAERSAQIADPRPPLLLQTAGHLHKCSVLIPGLPNDLALLIMVRLPRALHGSFRRVCRTWRDALQPSSVTALRNALHISEMWVILLFDSNRIAFYDPLLQRLSTPIPLCAHTDTVEVLSAVGSKLITISCPSSEPIGCGTIQCFDAADMQSQSDPFPLLRTEQIFYAGFTSAAIDDHVYVVGGADFSSGETPTVYKKAARFDVKTNTWEVMPDMHERRVAAEVVVLQGCLHVIGGCDYIYGVQSGEIWDPRSHEWKLEPELWPKQLSGHNVSPKMAVVLDILYALKEVKIKYDEQLDYDWELMQYVSASKRWISLGPFSIQEYECGCGPVDCQLVGAGEKLWVIINCLPKAGTCTARILSCVPSAGVTPPQWRSVAISSFPPGYAVVAGIAQL